MLVSIAPASAQCAYPGDPDCFTVVLLPDTQYYYNNEYPDNDNSHGIYDDQTCWIVANQAEHNTAFVMHLGDIIDDKCWIAIPPFWVDCPQDYLGLRWEWAHDAHEILWRPSDTDSDTCATDVTGLDPVRFSVLPGNHDGPPSFRNFNTVWPGTGVPDLDEAFGPDAFDCFMHARDCDTDHRYEYGESIELCDDPESPMAEEGGRNEANWQTFEAGGQSFLLLSLPSRNRGGADFYDVPSKDDICWANEIVSGKQDHHVIVATHGNVGELHYDDWEASCPRRSAGHIAGAATLYEELVARHGNIFMVVSGHVGDSEHRVRMGDVDGDGGVDQVVHEILTDYQFEDPQPDSSGSICYFSQCRSSD